MTPPTRLTLFVDNQNVYKCAREAFGPFSHFVDGQTCPKKIAELIASRGDSDGSPCVVNGVRVYTGYSDSSRSPTGYAAYRRQRQYWESQGCEVVARPLRYPYPFYPGDKPQEKGIDVHIALDIARLGLDKAFDVGVLFTTDTDLLPAIEFVRERCDGDVKMTVAAWDSPTSNRELRLPGLWCHRLAEADYNAVRDLTDYTK